MYREICIKRYFFQASFFGGDSSEIFEVSEKSLHLIKIFLGYLWGQMKEKEQFFDMFL